MDNSLDELIYKEEILEICFWYQGEGFGNEFTAQALSPFLNQPTEKVESVPVSYTHLTLPTSDLV